jgi:hypothetical protein
MVERPQSPKTFVMQILASGGLLVVMTTAIWLIDHRLETFAAGTTYYISPDGNDSRSGTSAANAWKTFSYAIPKLNPGDTLFVMNGVYTPTTTGLPVINCASGAVKNGSGISSPISIKAQNERKAHLKSNGLTTGVGMTGCSWWRIDGFYIESQENNPKTTNSTIDNGILIYDSSNIVIRRNVINKTNKEISAP